MNTIRAFITTALAAASLGLVALAGAPASAHGFMHGGSEHGFGHFDERFRFGGSYRRREEWRYGWGFHHDYCHWSDCGYGWRYHYPIYAPEVVVAAPPVCPVGFHLSEFGNHCLPYRP
jgi:hypothetical protein